VEARNLVGSSGRRAFVRNPELGSRNRCSCNGFCARMVCFPACIRSCTVLTVMRWRVSRTSTVVLLMALTRTRRGGCAPALPLDLELHSTAPAMTDAMPSSGSRFGVRVESRPEVPIDHASAISELRAILKAKMNEKGEIHSMRQSKATG
jgi:hypothetical protein